MLCLMYLQWLLILPYMSFWTASCSSGADGMISLIAASKGLLPVLLLESLIWVAVFSWYCIECKFLMSWNNALLWILDFIFLCDFWCVCCAVLRIKTPARNLLIPSVWEIMKVGFHLSLFRLWTMEYICVWLPTTVFWLVFTWETRLILYIPCTRGLHLYVLAQWTRIGTMFWYMFHICYVFIRSRVCLELHQDSC